MNLPIELPFEKISNSIAEEKAKEVAEMLTLNLAELIGEKENKDEIMEKMYVDFFHAAYNKIMDNYLVIH